MTIFTERLKELKEQSGKTQLEIAKAIGITPQAFSYYMNGRQPPFEILIKIAKYFNVTTDYLLGLSDFRNPESKEMNTKTGLSEKAIAFLSKSDNLKITNAILSSDNELLTELYINITAYLKTEKIVNYMLNSMGAQMIYDLEKDCDFKVANALKSGYESRELDSMERIIENILNKIKTETNLVDELSSILYIQDSGKWVEVNEGDSDNGEH